MEGAEHRPPEVRPGKITGNGRVRLEFTNPMMLPGKSELIELNKKSEKKMKSSSIWKSASSLKTIGDDISSTSMGTGYLGCNFREKKAKSNKVGLTDLTKQFYRRRTCYH